jgi:hypothetical protein
MANKYNNNKLFEPILDRLKVKGSPVKPKVRPNVKPGKDPGLAWVEYTTHKLGDEPDTAENRKRFIENAVVLNRSPIYKNEVKETLQSVKPVKKFDQFDTSTWPMNQKQNLDDWEVIDRFMSGKEKKEFYTRNAKNPVIKSFMTKKELDYVQKPYYPKIDITPINTTMPKVMPKEPEEDLRITIKKRADARLKQEQEDYAKLYGVNGIASLKVPE